MFHYFTQNRFKISYRQKQTSNNDTMHSYVLYQFSPEGVRSGLSALDAKTDQADFTDWRFFLLSNLMEEISPNPVKISEQIPKDFPQQRIAERRKMI